LEVLHISHNQIQDLSPQAFHNASYLRHLDMSSNHLRAVETHYFDTLVSLEELLLYNNRIQRVAENAFAKLSGLRKVYLSWNNLTTFPFRSVQGLGNYGLRTIGLYLHNNPVRCSCPLYLMLQRWKKQGFSSVKDFFEEHTCKVSDNVPRSLIKLLKYSHMFENCSAGPEEVHPVPFPVVVGQALLLTCNTSLPGTATTYMWISPHHEPIKHPGNSNRSLEVYHNGSLKITAAKPWHSGVYVGLAIDSPHNFSRLCEVNVTVHYPKPEGEIFSTGLTTLLGCIVSLVLVIIYLYLTPCRCLSCCKKPAPLSPPQECSAQSSSILSTTPPTTDGPHRKVSANKHVAFLEPVRETQNGKIRLALGEDLPDPKHPKVLQLKSDSESISSVFSDTPIVS
ncbi:PREDICTED: amphoterin-induced protein 3, partial [Merops nubicus]|uniref:amphoterin-induced protein 3 n=1 Tax=Merops nubicus TaxID=57421 RepID=UPI0004F023C3